MSDAREAMEAQSKYIYAGFWRRVPALVLDLLLVSLFMMLIDALHLAYAGVPFDVAFKLESASNAFSLHYNPTRFGVWTGLLASLTYFVTFESSRLRATPGKIAMRLIVVDKTGGRLSMVQAFGRTLGKVPSAGIFWIGFMMAGWTARKQALHDLMARSVVLKQLDEPLPPDMLLSAS